MTAKEYFEYDQDTIPFKECSTRDAEEYDYNGEEPPYSKYEMIAFSEGYYKKKLALCSVSISDSLDMKIKTLEHVDELVDQKMVCFKNIPELQKEREQKALLIGFVIWRCNQNIQDIYGETIFTKGLIYEQVKTDEYPMMLIDNRVEESEVYNLKDYFTSI
tara:strand:+ start:265 stop:747 length:483 start_codon:yes stop_codon:yes gene_type:complete